MIGASGEFGVTALRVKGKTGIWVQVGERAAATEEKLGAIGVHISRWGDDATVCVQRFDGLALF